MWLWGYHDHTSFVVAPSSYSVVHIFQLFRNFFSASGTKKEKKKKKTLTSTSIGWRK